MLGMVLNHWVAISIGFLIFFGGSWFLVPYLGQNFFPTVDAGQFRLHVRAPGGTRIEETTRLVDRVEAVIREVIPAEQLGGILDNIGIPSGGIPLNYLNNGTTGTADADILVSLHPEHDPAEALKANQNLKAAVARYDQARSALGAAEAAQFPRLGVSAQPVYQHDSKHRPIGGRPERSYDVTSVPFDFSYEIDLWGRVRRSVEAATAQAEASADDIESVRLSMEAELAAAWIQLRSLDAEKAILEAGIDVYRKALDLVQNRRSLGMVSDLDLAQAQTVLNSAQAQRTDISVQRAKYQNAIALLCGKTASLFQLPERPLSMGSMVVPTGLPSELLERRPDIAAAERRMAAANADVGVAMAALYPTIKFSGVAGFQSRDLYQLFDWPSRYWAVGPSLFWPVFQGGQLEAAERQRMAAYEESVARYRQTVLSAFSEVETNLAAQNRLAEEIEQVYQALALARKQLEIVTY